MSGVSDICHDNIIIIIMVRIRGVKVRVGVEYVMSTMGDKCPGGESVLRSPHRLYIVGLPSQPLPCGGAGAPSRRDPGAFDVVVVVVVAV